MVFVHQFSSILLVFELYSVTDLELFGRYLATIFWRGILGVHPPMLLFDCLFSGIWAHSATDSGVTGGGILLPPPVVFGCHILVIFRRYTRSGIFVSAGEN